MRSRTENEIRAEVRNSYETKHLREKLETLNHKILNVEYKHLRQTSALLDTFHESTKTTGSSPHAIRPKRHSTDMIDYQSNVRPWLYFQHTKLEGTVGKLDRIHFERMAAAAKRHEKKQLSHRYTNPFLLNDNENDTTSKEQSLQVNQKSSEQEIRVGSSVQNAVTEPQRKMPMHRKTSSLPQATRLQFTYSAQQRKDTISNFPKTTFVEEQIFQASMNRDKVVQSAENTDLKGPLNKLSESDKKILVHKEATQRVSLPPQTTQTSTLSSRTGQFRLHGRRSTHSGFTKKDRDEFKKKEMEILRPKTSVVKGFQRSVSVTERPHTAAADERDSDDFDAESTSGAPSQPKWVQNYVKPQERYKIDNFLLLRREKLRSETTPTETPFDFNDEIVPLNTAYSKSARKRAMEQLKLECEKIKNEDKLPAVVANVQNKVKEFLEKMDTYRHHDKEEAIKCD